MSSRTRRRVVYLCDACGETAGQWMGRCPHCGEWNTLHEMVLATSGRPELRGAFRNEGAALVELASIPTSRLPRLELPMPEINRVLGGGMVPGAALLLGGEPGIGKSTLLLQIADALAGPGTPVMYGAGEESPEQIKLRAERLGLQGNGLLVLPETDLAALLERLEQAAPRLAIIDSIQTLAAEGVSSSPGSLAQVRECGLQLTRWARANGAALFLAGHVTKDGAIAGPRVLEHTVDVVLYLEGEPSSGYRVLRSVKNRFGATQDVALLQMGENGLREVADPSEALLAERARDGVGSVVVPTLEGTRPLLVEVQALVSPATSPVPRRMANGVDFHRLLMVAAVLGRRLGTPLFDQDILVNVAGGLRISEPAADLGMALALLSSLRDSPVDPQLLVVGEVGLSGEVRRVGRLPSRLVEGARLGFRRVLVPPGASSEVRGEVELQVAEVETLQEAARQAGLGPKAPRDKR